MSVALLPTLVARLAADRPLRAGSFIVTLYGDVVLPRQVSLWIGNVIETCQLVGINESQSRTAVSRLVESGRLVGLKAGRRSYYRLTDAAAAEFDAAARRIHGPGETVTPAGAPGRPWTVVLLRGAGRTAAQEALARSGFGAAAPGVAVKPGDHAAAARAVLDKRAMATPGCGAAVTPVILVTPPDGDPEALAALAADAWDLAGLAGAYAAFHTRFNSVETALVRAPTLADNASLAIRLLLVHAFRHVALRDPVLPAVALPRPWPGRPARALFRSLYDRLSPRAEAHIQACYCDVTGPLGAVAG